MSIPRLYFDDMMAGLRQQFHYHVGGHHNYLAIWRVEQHTNPKLFNIECVAKHCNVFDKKRAYSKTCYGYTADRAEFASLSNYYTNWVRSCDQYQSFLKSRSASHPSFKQSNITDLKDQLRFWGLQDYKLYQLDSPIKYILSVQINLSEFISNPVEHEFSVEFNVFHFYLNVSDMQGFALGLIRDLMVEYILVKKEQVLDDFTDQCMRVLI